MCDRDQRYPLYYYYISNSMLRPLGAIKVWRRLPLFGEAWGLRGEVGEGPSTEVLEDSVLAFGPGIVQGTGAALAAGALLHDAVRDLERALYGLYGVAQGELFGRSGEAGASPPPLATLHQTGARASPSRGRAAAAAPPPRP